MNPPTTGLTFTEFEVGPEGIDGFRAWHSGEHVHERLAVDGVVGARRYASTGRERRFIGYYRAVNSDVFLSAAYRGLFANVSDETKRIGAHVNGTRFVGDIVAELGDGYGGFALRVRFTTTPDRDDGVIDWIASNGPAIGAANGIARMMLARPRREVDNVSDANWILFLEAETDQAFDGLPLPDGASLETYRLERLWPEGVAK